MKGLHTHQLRLPQTFLGNDLTKLTPEDSEARRGYKTNVRSRKQYLAVLAWKPDKTQEKVDGIVRRGKHSCMCLMWTHPELTRY